MPLYIDKTIGKVNKKKRLGTIRTEDEEEGEIFEVVDYRMFLAQKDFLLLSVPKKNSPQRESTNYALFWQTLCTMKQLYHPSLQFFHEAQQLLGEERKNDQGRVSVMQWGAENSYKEFALESYLQRDPKVLSLLSRGFDLPQGQLEIETSFFILRLGHYTEGKRVLVASASDFSDAIGKLAFKTYPYDFQQEDLLSVQGAVSYLLQEKVFKYPVH